MTRTSLILLSCLAAGCFHESDVSADTMDESSSDDGASESSATSVGTTVSTTTAATSATTAGSGSGTDDESSDGGSGESDGTDEGSTGEPSDDFALAFAGQGGAASAAFAWDAPDFTVEAWIEILDEDATGILVDHQDPAAGVGWSLFVHAEWHVFTLEFFDGGHAKQTVVGGSPQQLGVGWHHVAVTKDGAVVVFHMDGVALPTVPVSPTVAVSDVPFSVGARAGTASLEWINVDDVRISDVARYSANFAPPAVFGNDPDAVILLDFDEGDGTEAVDGADSIGFTITSPQWVAGHE